MIPRIEETFRERFSRLKRELNEGTWHPDPMHAAPYHSLKIALKEAHDRLAETQRDLQVATHDLEYTRDAIIQYLDDGKLNEFQATELLGVTPPQKLPDSDTEDGGHEWTRAIIREQLDTCPDNDPWGIGLYAYGPTTNDATIEDCVNEGIADFVAGTKKDDLCLYVNPVVYADFAERKAETFELFNAKVAVYKRGEMPADKALLIPRGPVDNMSLITLPPIAGGTNKPTDS